MPPTCIFVITAVLFGALALLFFVIFIIGLIAKWRSWKLIGGISLAACLGMVLLSIAGSFFVMFMIFIEDELPRTRNRPEIKDIVGVYRVSRQKGIFPLKTKSSKISETSVTLREDGSFEMKNVPSECVDIFASKESFGSGSGTWELEREEGLLDTWNITLSFTKSEGFGHKKGEFIFVNMLQLRNQKPPYIIYIILSDPDEGRGLKFEKEKL